MKYYQYIIIFFCIFIQLIWSHGIHHHDGEEGEEGHEHSEKEYSVGVSIAGVAGVLLSSFMGTVLPIIFRKKDYFREDTVLFSSIKLFGTGVILSVAFIHMLIPAGQILSSEFTYKLFYEDYTSFAGVFAILGIMLTHIIQVYTSHFLIKNSESLEDVKKTSHEHVGDGCSEDQHGLMHMMENKEKQIICYLLEIGISLHSILIGVAFGMTKDEELIVLMIALIFHQFFEGISLSSVFIEAHFKRFTAIAIMVVVYSLTLPFGAIIGIIIRSAIESTDKAYLTTQGIIDAIAGGILVYDDLVNILSRHCSSSMFKQCSIMNKNIQLLSFYCGIAVMAIIGIWA
ncbi:Zinc/iron permease [Neocallimastix lanati (nom. inval.)]|uniref:Zinc/iron permease n=1 Tax=Neocallimastix californiae TaxID=1754190 RepID=A0A1Y2D4T5_9FUNG|nr:Zinc/iron permease [Neocallimastix sp. JGI-2020a]ORY54106.1 Zinc/iron permease [Neocallimastix californiae]|eukprot:ORY54106.1 Zinc/iron permease [Neocallimastix californiae]